MAYFKLTDRHAETKLFSSEDLTGATGMPLMVLPLSHFSGWECLQRGNPLPKEIQALRHHEIEKALYKEGSPFSTIEAVSPWSSHAPQRFFDQCEVGEAADSPYAICVPKFGPYDCERDPSTHFQKIVTYGADAIVNPPTGGGFYLYPGAFSREGQNIFDGVGRARGAFIMAHHPADMTAKEWWSKWTGIGQKHLTKAPTDGWHLAGERLHEWRHVRQEVGLPGSSFRNGREIDSDLFLLSVLQQAGAETGATRKAWLDTRHLGLLTSNYEEYWVAPSLEALHSPILETRLAAPDFPTVSRITREIRRQLILERNEVDCREAQAMPEGRAVAHPANQTESTNVNRLLSEYEDWASLLTARRAVEELFPYLVRIVAKNVFADESTRNVANRILEAAASFAPEAVSAARTRRYHLVAQAA